MRDWSLGTRDGDWVSMGIPSDGSYGIAPGIVYGYPCICKNGDYFTKRGDPDIQALKTELPELFATPAQPAPRLAGGSAGREARSVGGLERSLEQARRLLAPAGNSRALDGAQELVIGMFRAGVEKL